MSSNPQPPMQPMQSNAIKFLLFTGLGNCLLQTIPMLQAHKFDYWNLGITVVTTLAGILLRMGQGDINAPKLLNNMTFGILNKANP